MHTNYVIVGAGLTGAVIARLLTDAGEAVIVLDRRSEIAGNVADYFHPSGIHVHRYGPHLFRTVSDDIWAFVNRFAAFHSYKHQIRTLVDGQLQNWPIAASYIRSTCGAEWAPALSGSQARNFEEAALSLMPRLIYERFVEGYNSKQWGVPASQLEASLCKRFDVRHDDNPYLTPKAKYQAIPTQGYSAMVQNMLKGIPVVLSVDYLRDPTAFTAKKKLVFTGPIDEFFGFALGRLSYRGQRRSLTYHADHDWIFPCGQINAPNDGDHIRDIEWKHMMRPDYAGRIRGTLITRETPYTPQDPEQYEYPFPDETNRSLFARYQQLAATRPHVVICGRLGEYRYYDMDHAIGRAMTIAKKLLANESPGV